MRLALLPLVFIAACKGEKPPQPVESSAAPNSAEGPGSAKPAGSGSADGSGSNAAPVCDLVGDYRVRGQASEASDGEWLRFRVAGTPLAANILNQHTLLGLSPTEVRTTTDAARCQIKISVKHAFGTGEVALTLDPKTGALTGESTVTEFQRPPATTSVHGVRGATTIAPEDACFAPGVYLLKLDRKHAWRAPSSETRCFDPVGNLGRHYLRVEWLGDALVIDAVEGTETLLAGAKPWHPWEKSKETIKRAGACEVELTMKSSGVTMNGKLRFASNAIIGTMEHVEAGGVVGGDEAESYWQCETTNLPITAKRVATPQWSE